ncbi:P-loop containing nucleoside triphosphate hydrolase protein [Pelagophyceae sp. CCMP2097]|nr:P-loop containing nucleoside triphosphate hydrolase protein [Pelagophyceae sp. CCMP2097]
MSKDEGVELSQILKATVQPCALEWTDVVCATPSARILRGVSGSAEASELCGVLGPSGSGKSTLVSALSQRYHGGAVKVLHGEIRYGGAQWTKALKRRIGFVEQEDCLLADLTVRQTVSFAAELRRDARLESAASAAARADAIIDALGIRSCAQQRIGGSNAQRSISGGQRRRVSIGCELILDPSLILLDEPTSGLDSFAAMKVFSLLVDLAHHGRTVVATLHQPTDAMFLRFDKVVLLAAGICVYAGPARGAEQAFLEDRPPGVPIADFLLEIISTLPVVSFEEGKESRDDASILLDDVCGVSLAPGARAMPDDVEAAKPAAKPAVEDDAAAPLGWWEQTWILSRRTVLAHRLDFIDKLFFANVFSINMALCLLWWQSATRRPRSATDVGDIAGLLFFVHLYWAYQLMLRALFSFPADVAVLRKERAAGLYRLGAFFFARTAADTLTAGFVAPFFAPIVYFACGLRPSQIGLHLAFMLLNALVANSAGLLLGAAFLELKTATTVQLIFMLTSMLTGGFYVSRLPTWLTWVRLFSFCYYVFGAFLKIELAGTHYVDDAGLRRDINRLDALQPFDLDAPLGNDALALVLFTIIFRLLAYFALRRNTA